jgi:hypothetical protein
MKETPDADFLSNLELMYSYHPINKDLIIKSWDPSFSIIEDFETQEESYLNVYEGIFAFGIQNGEWIKTLLPWLDAHPQRRLIICESCPKTYAHFFKHHFSYELITHDRLHFLLTPDGINKDHLSYLENIISTVIMKMNLKNALFIEHKQRKDDKGERKLNFEDAIEKGLSDFYSSDIYLKGQHHKTIVNIYEYFHSSGGLSRKLPQKCF